MKKGIDEETFFRTDISDILDEVNELIINPIYDRIVQQLAIDLYWQRTPYKLLHRIFKLREDKLLERVNQKCTNSKIDPSNIVEYFSEKSQDAVDNQQESLIENIKSE